MTRIQIRQEQPADFREAERVTREAFWNCYAPGCTEHYLLHVMRGAPAFVPSLDFVAVADGNIVGSVVFCKAFILGDNGNRYEVLTLGPIAVLPALQRQGVGRVLIAHARNAAAKQGYRAILLCGDPEYYAKTGFTPAERFGIRTSENKYAAALHACPLHADALKNVAGRYFEDAVYAVDEAGALAFDQQFPAKERLASTPAQRRFEQVLAMQRPCQG